LNYQCLGAYQNQNGFENSLLNISVPLLNGKLSLSGSSGIQNDLTDTVASQKAARFITTVNATYNPNEKLSLTGNYSNNRSVTNFRNLDNISNINNVVPYFLDSLRLVQLNLNAGLNVTYQLKASKTQKQSLAASYSLQKGSQKAGDYFVDEEGNSFHNATLGITTNYPKSTIQWSVNLLYSLNTQGLESKTMAFGPSVTFSKKIFKKKMNVAFASSYNSTYTNVTMYRVNVANFKLNLGYNIKQRHDFKLSGTYQTKTSANGLKLTNTYNSTGLITLNYTYTF